MIFAILRKAGTPGGEALHAADLYSPAVTSNVTPYSTDPKILVNPGPAELWRITEPRIIGEATGRHDMNELTIEKRDATDRCISQAQRAISDGGEDRRTRSRGLELLRRRRPEQVHRQDRGVAAEAGRPDGRPAR